MTDERSAPLPRRRLGRAGGHASSGHPGAPRPGLPASRAGGAAGRRAARAADPVRHARAPRRRRCRSCPSRRCSATTCISRQETLGMMGISLFGTCTMKYNARVSEAIAPAPELAERASAAAGRHAAGHPRDRSTASISSCASSPAWTSSSSRPAAAPTPPTPIACVTRAYHQAARRARRSATRSSPRSRRIPATPRRRRRPGFKVDHAARWRRTAIPRSRR